MRLAQVPRYATLRREAYSQARPGESEASIYVLVDLYELAEQMADQHFQFYCFLEVLYHMSAAIDEV